jgi:integrase
MNSLAVLDAVNADIANLRDQVQQNLESSESVSTKKAHKSDWADFERWCREHHTPALPARPDAVAAYISDLAASSRPSTIQRRLATVSVAHKASGLTSPTGDLLVRKVLKGIKNRVGTARIKKAPLRVADLRRVNEVLPNTLKGKRDLAILLIGFFGGMRRSELVGLDLADIQFVAEGVRVTIRRSKCDQQGEGHVKDLSFGSQRELCPVFALKGWIELAGITEGPIFRPITRHGKMSPERLSGKAVGGVVKEIAEALKLDSELYGGHSLRAGFVTDCLKHGVPTPVIKRITGHRSDSMLAEYMREAQMFDYNLTAALGL